MSQADRASVARASPNDGAMPRSSFRALARSLLIGHIAFLTLVDLFATQAILPLLTRAYGVAPAAIGLAVNASTLGMAVASLAVAFFSQRLDRRRGIILSLALLAIPTFLLAFAPNLAVFAALRIAQGLCMASAFTLTLAYLGERRSASDPAGAFAAYVTGSVASNLLGRLISAAVAGHFGLASNFFVFAGLNLAGAVLVYLTIDRVPPMEAEEAQKRPASHVLATHLSNSGLRATFAIGFCILFAFIGIFTYVNFVLVRPPIAIGMMTVGFVYFVFAPSFVTTPLAGKMAGRLGTRPALWSGLGLAAIGLPLILAPRLEPVIAGMILAGVGTFFAQAVATGFVGRAAAADRGAASGMYLACYFAGGLAGTAVLGFIFDRFGWPACVFGIGLALALAAALAPRLVIAGDAAR